MKMPKVDVDLRPYYAGEERGHHDKTLIVLHETVSYNRPGLTDITGPAAFLDASGLEIHGVIDQEGNSGWCYDPTAVYDHAASGGGAVNTRSIGFELVSEIPFLKTVTERRKAWRSKARVKQLDQTAEWVAWLHLTQGIPLQYSDSGAGSAGVTTHWSVSREWLGGHGHWDCHPIHLGGHFPASYVIHKARQIAKGS